MTCIKTQKTCCPENDNCRIAKKIFAVFFFLPTVYLH